MKKQSTIFKALPDKELNEILQEFFVSVHTKAGNPYSKSGMVNIRSGINRYLCLPPSIAPSI